LKVLLSLQLKNNNAKNKKENTLSFFNFETETPNEFDKTIATKIRDAIRKKKIRRKASIKQWANHIKLLRTSDNQSESAIEELLEWWIKNIEDQYTPVIQSAKSFREKFDQLISARERKTPSTANVKVSDKANKLAQDLLQLNWPKGSNKQVAAVVELTIARYEQFRTKLRDVEPSTPKLARFRKELLEQLPGQLHFARQWMYKAHRQIEGWEDWSGDLSKFTFTEDSNTFNAMCCDVATNYCNDADRWFKLKDEINQ